MEKIIDLTGNYGTIKYDVRDNLGLTNNEYLGLDFIAKMQGRPSVENAGYCGASPKYLAKIMGIAERNYYAFCKRMEALGLAERHPKSRKLRVTLKAYELIAGKTDETSLKLSTDETSPKTNKSVTKHHRATDETSLHYNIDYNKDKNNSVSGETPHTHTKDFNLSVEEKKQNQKRKAAAPRKIAAAAHTPKEVYERLCEESTEYGQFFRDVWKIWADYLEHREEIKTKKYASAKSEALAVIAFHKISGGNVSLCKKIVEQSRYKQWIGLLPLKEDLTVEPIKPQQSRIPTYGQ